MAQERGDFPALVRPLGPLQKANVRRYRMEIALGKQDSQVVTGRRVHLWITSKATRVWLPYGNTNLDKGTDMFRF